MFKTCFMTFKTILEKFFFWFPKIQYETTQLFDIRHLENLQKKKQKKCSSFILKTCFTTFKTIFEKKKFCSKK